MHFPIKNLFAKVVFLFFFTKDYLQNFMLKFIYIYDNFALIPNINLNNLNLW